ncbi:hypothetical protein N7474_004584 [Penicillium riverlandense]|uniref:uncharacterized protein n=1 Tax=Penicillium riverlandense TaxID=1903569 RepID=UPI0025480F7F|nr:uncharacterized protein N7474_004584 [Penicillium riverlandense]KAJ5818993.1 hypothetical protein N7474_004584 [Penicillium riverlandense]
MELVQRSLPLVLSPPLTVDNDVNHNGVIMVITSFALFLVLGSLGIRVYSAYSRRARQMDDWAFAFTVVFALTQISVVFAQINFGWGKEGSLIATGHRSQMDKAVYSADILYVSTLVLSKASTSVFYRTITTRSSQWIIHGILGLVGLWALIAIIMLAIRCGSHPWQDINQECPSLFPRWQATAALDIILDTVLVLYPMKVIPRLHTTLTKKVTVLLVLSCRVLLIPTSAVHLHYMHQQINSSNPTLVGSFATIAAELHVALSVVVLIAPLMKPFIAAYIDENGFAYTDCASKSESPSSSRSRAYKFLPRKTPGPSPCSSELQGGNRIVKSVQISVDHETMELSGQSAAFPECQPPTAR